MHKRLTQSPGNPSSQRPQKTARGFTTLELVMVMVVGLILAAIAVPLIQSSLRSFRLSAAVNSITGAIQSTRYRAILDGCRYAVNFNKDDNTYQISSAVTGGACAPVLTNVGPAVPFGRLSDIALSQNVAFQFSPGGSVQVLTGAQTFNLSYVGESEDEKIITVTKYGSISVH